MLFEDGNAKLGDLGLVKKNLAKNQRTSTICGTAEYMAYEIYHRDPYDENVDWWSLGILTFELCTFHTPFYANSSSEITEKVLSAQVNYPEHMANDVQSFIAALLERNPRRRLGNQHSPHGSLRQQAFFK